MQERILLRDYEKNQNRQWWGVFIVGISSPITRHPFMRFDQALLSKQEIEKSLNVAVEIRLT